MVDYDDPEYVDSRILEIDFEIKKSFLMYYDQNSVEMKKAFAEEEPKCSPEEFSEESPGGSPEESPGGSPEGSPGEFPEGASKESPEDSPEESSEGLSKDSPGESPEEDWFNLEAFLQNNDTEFLSRRISVFSAAAASILCLISFLFKGPGGLFLGLFLGAIVGAMVFAGVYAVLMLLFAGLKFYVDFTKKQ